MSRAALRQVTAARVSMLPHEIQRLGAIPIGVGLAWLGYDHWAKVRSHPSALKPIERLDLSKLSTGS